MGSKARCARSGSPMPRRSTSFRSSRRASWRANRRARARKRGHGWRCESNAKRCCKLDLTYHWQWFTHPSEQYDITSNSLQIATCRQIKCRLKATKPLDLSPLRSGLSNRSIGKLAERRGRKASGLTDSFPKTAGLPRWPRFDLGSGFAIEEKCEPTVTSAKRIKRAPSPIEMSHCRAAARLRRFAFGHGEEDVDKSTSTAQLAVTPPPLAAASGTGSALFVINLCASIAPVRLDGNNIPGLENYRLYQVARNEDGRTRHRLRLGFFTSESHAESVLTVVRQQYPTAFTACLCEEDRRFARGFLPDSAPAQPKPAAAQAKPTAAVAQPKPAAPVAASKPVAPAAPAKQPTAAAKTPAAAESEIVELTWEPETPAPAAAATKAAPKAASSAPASKAAVAPTEGLDEFTWEPPSLTPAADAAIAKSAAAGVVKAKPATEKPAAEKVTSDTAKHPALKLAPKAPPAKAAAPVVAKAATPVAAKPTVPPVAAKPAVKPSAPPAAPSPASKPDAASSMRVRALDLSFSDPPAPKHAQPAAPATPFHVGKGVEIKDTG